MLASVWVISLKVQKVPFWLCPWIWNKQEKSADFEIFYHWIINFDIKSNYKALLDLWRGLKAAEAEFYLCSEAHQIRFLGLASAVAWDRSLNIGAPERSHGSTNLTQKRFGLKSSIWAGTTIFHALDSLNFRGHSEVCFEVGGYFVTR